MGTEPANTAVLEFDIPRIVENKAGEQSSKENWFMMIAYTGDMFNGLCVSQRDLVKKIWNKCVQMEAGNEWCPPMV